MPAEISRFKEGKKESYGKWIVSKKEAWMLLITTKLESIR